jgi:hypothetical protein
LRERIAD